jgi:hypothetical protein
MELTKNGGAPKPAMVSISWIRDDFSNGRRRYKAYAMMTGGGNPNPTVIGEATLEVPNLEVAKILQAAMGEMLAKQPLEIIQVKP